MNITDLLTDKKYLQISRNVCRNHNLLHDLHSEAILVILEKKVDINTIRNLEHYSILRFKTNKRANNK